jgi:predicted nuclease of predicted toxin-antitoxin system
MRFLVDASVSPVVADLLAEAGHEAVHVGVALQLEAHDHEILEHAADHGQVIVSAGR